MGAVKFGRAAVGIDALAALPVVRERTPSRGMLIPIPAHPDNEAKRGFNQAERLARVLSRQNPALTVGDFLRRTRESLPQVGLSARQRQANVENLYSWNGPSLKGVRCILVDDITTTGATFSDAVRAVKIAGARGVTAFTLAQTPPRVVRKTLRSLNY